MMNDLAWLRSVPDTCSAVTAVLLYRVRRDGEQRKAIPT